MNRLTALFLLLFFLTLLAQPLPLFAQEEDETLVETTETLTEEPAPAEVPAVPTWKAGDKIKASGPLQDAVSDEDGKVQYYGVWDNKDFCYWLIENDEKGKELAKLNGKNVQVEGSFLKELDGNRLIAVTSFNEVKEAVPAKEEAVPADEPAVDESAGEEY